MNHGNKGVTFYISHVLGLALLLLAFGLISFNMVTYYQNISEESQETQARVISQAITEEVVELESIYRDSDTRPEDGENVTLAKVVMDVPQQVSGKSYTIEFLPRQDFWITNEVAVSGEDKSIIEETRPHSRMRITTEGLPSIEHTHDFNNLLALTEGEATRTNRIRLSYVRIRDGGITNKIILEAV